MLPTQPVLCIESLDQAAVLLKPLRVALLRAMGEPRTCPELAEQFGETPQKIYYHVKTLERAGLVERTGQRSVNGIPEGFYRACAQSYWLSPRLVKRYGGRRAIRDQTSLGILASHAEEMLEDVGRLADQSAAGAHVPSLSLSAEISLPSAEHRQRFLDELRDTFDAIARRHGARAEDPHRTESFRFTIACYPTENGEAE